MFIFCVLVHVAPVRFNSHKNEVKNSLNKIQHRFAIRNDEQQFIHNEKHPFCHIHN